jgi:hypothetical protein
LDVIGCQVYLEGMRQRPFQAFFPAGTAIVKIRAASSHFSGRVHMHPIRLANQADQ